MGMKNLDAGDWGLLECEEKKYDAKQTASFSDDLVRDFQDYHDRAKGLEAGYGRYYNNTTHVGKAAEASKEFIVRRQTDEIHFENLDIQREFLSKVFYIENAFKDMVDPSPNAKIDSVVLKKIKQEQQVFSRVFDEEGYELECWTKMMVEEFGKFGVSTLPSCSLIRELYEELSGPGGHLDKCNKRLKEFDEYCLNYLKQSGLKERVYNLQCTIKNTACGLDGLTVYTPCMAKNPIDVIKKIINFFNPSKKSNDKPSDEVEELRKEKIELKKMEKQEEQKIYAYIQKTYGYSKEDMDYLKCNHKELLLSLYDAASNKNSVDEDKIRQHINTLLDPTMNMTKVSKTSYIRNAEIIDDMETTNNGRFDAELEYVKKIYNENKDIYMSISQKTGVPPELICAIHFRESACNFDTHLHNGQPLGQPTTIVPKSVCFDNFEDAAVDALMNNKDKTGISFDGRVDDATCLAFAEAFNGYGYSNNGHISPYLYSGTSAYTSGKYVSDHNFDPNAVDKQAGIYCVMQALKEE